MPKVRPWPRVAREADVSEFFGQEMNRTTYNLAGMNKMARTIRALLKSGQSYRAV